MTAQDIFDRVYRHFIYEGGQLSVSDEDLCVYRDASGAKCAVGVLLEDSEYSLGMEENNVSELVRLGLLPSRLVPHAGLLQMLQKAHDDVVHDYDGDGWRGHMQTALRAIAGKLDLNIPDPTETNVRQYEEP